MNEHSELVKEARDLAFINDAWAGPAGEFRDVTQRNHKAVATTLRRLATIVEAHDKAPRFAANIKAIREQIDALERRSGGQAVNAELLAACKACDEVIAMFIAEYPCRDRDMWAELRAAGDLAKRTVENADAVDDCDECVKANLVRDAVRQLDTTGEAEWVDLDEFKAKGG